MMSVLGRFRRLNWLTILALVIGAPFYAALAWAVLASALVRSGDPGGWTQFFSFLALPFAFVFASLFDSVNTYVLLSVVGIALGIAALVWERRSRWARIGALLVILSIVAFPWVYRYSPPLAAAPGYELRCITQPDFPDSVVKASQVTTEQCPCQYELLGWSADGQLYYQATCGAETQAWRYIPSLNRSERISMVPADLNQATISSSQVLAMVRAAGVWPPDSEPVMRRLHVRGKGLVSPDGRWSAIVTRHVYGPEDVAVLTALP